MYNLAMMHLAKEGGGCDTARELLKKVAGEAAPTYEAVCMPMKQVWGTQYDVDPAADCPDVRPCVVSC